MSQISGDLFRRTIYEKLDGPLVETQSLKKFRAMIHWLLSNNYKINIFTLNHDLLLDKVFENHFEIYDGFNECDERTFNFHLEYLKGIKFKGPFNALTRNDKNHKIQIFHLHCGLNLFIHGDHDILSREFPKHYGLFKAYNLKQNDPTLIFSNRYIESNNYSRSITPTMLSGLTTKKIWIPWGLDYSNYCFRSLEDSLSKSKEILMIGYGGQDQHLDLIFRRCNIATRKPNNSKVFLYLKKETESLIANIDNFFDIRHDNDSFGDYGLLSSSKDLKFEDFLSCEIFNS
jgi:hypothetical protein